MNRLVQVVICIPQVRDYAPIVHFCVIHNWCLTIFNQDSLLNLTSECCVPYFSNTELEGSPYVWNPPWMLAQNVLPDMAVWEDPRP